jgi:hypothetical protein
MNEKISSRDVIVNLIFPLIGIAIGVAIALIISKYEKMTLDMIIVCFLLSGLMFLLLSFPISNYILKNYGFKKELDQNRHYLEENKRLNDSLKLAKDDYEKTINDFRQYEKRLREQVSQIVVNVEISEHNYITVNGNTVDRSSLLEHMQFLVTDLKGILNKKI